MKSPDNDDDEFISSLRHHRDSEDLEDRKDEFPTGLQRYESDELSNSDSENSDGSNLSTISEKSDYFNSKISYQRRALIRKSISLQMRQIGTNV
jgi:hypothetical protein